MATFDSRFQHAEWLIDEGKELDAFENRLPVVYKQNWHALIPFFDKSDTQENQQFHLPAHTNQIKRETHNLSFALCPSGVFRVRDVFGTLRKDIESQEYPYKENIVSLRRTLSHGVYVDSDFMCVNQTWRSKRVRVMERRKAFVLLEQGKKVTFRVPT